MECVSSIDLMKAEGERHMRATELLERMVSMHTGLVKKPM